MSRRSQKAEHGGAKNGGGWWGRREEAKTRSRKIRRANDRDAVREVSERPPASPLEAAVPASESARRGGK